MKVCLFAYSLQGLSRAEKIEGALSGHSVEKFSAERLSNPQFEAIPRPSEEFYEEKFKSSDALIFVGSCGIAIRLIAPYIKSKTQDPAVLVADELGRFIIPILSGHIGGANELAEELAEKLGSEPVITTASDINGRFSPDSFARRNGFIIHSMEKAKLIAAAILEGDVGIESELPLPEKLPAGLREGSCPKGIYLGSRIKEPFELTLRLIPRNLTLGIGCRRGTESGIIAEALELLLKENGIDRRALKEAASIDIKKDEKGLLDFCEAEKLPVKFYPAERLMAEPGDFQASEFVQRITGADNVCERAAAVGGKRIIVGKTVYKGVTLALSEEKTEVNFGKA